MSRRNPRCFMDIQTGDEDAQRVVFELFAHESPRTVENFRSLCTGETGLSYKTSVFHRLIRGFMIQGGDITERNGLGGVSIYGQVFDDESLFRKHDAPFLLSMANRGPNTNSSQFFVTLAPAPHLDDKHCVFGRVVGGQAFLQGLDKVSTDASDRPLQPISVTHCGELEYRGPDRSARKPSKTTSKRRRRRSSSSPSSPSSLTSSDSSSSSSSSDSDSETRRRKRRKDKRSKRKSTSARPDKLLAPLDKSSTLSLSAQSEQSLVDAEVDAGVDARRTSILDRIVVRSSIGPLHSSFCRDLSISSSLASRLGTRNSIQASPVDTNPRDEIRGRGQTRYHMALQGIQRDRQRLSKPQHTRQHRLAEPIPIKPTDLVTEIYNRFAQGEPVEAGESF